MKDLSLKYNQDFKHTNAVEDIFKDIESDKDNNVLSVDKRNSRSNIENIDIDKINREFRRKNNKRYILLFSVFFGLITLFIVFIIVVILGFISEATKAVFVF
ncbi:MAG TPA: hypothetical protein PLM63_01930 [bacterium]|nr:hypothetical protein [Patescibacteria group bacterium]HOC96485.1 hypothetical protein [bacterium]HPO11317.1 hypothetical protein [bacterium]HQL11641.1 hypothetical protein [bacterium]